MTVPVDLPARAKARFDPAERYGLRLTLVGLAIVLVAVPFATLLFQVLGKGPLTRVDGRLANAGNAWVHDHEWVIPWLKDVSWLGRPPLLAVWVLITAAVMLRTGRRRIAIFVVVTSLGGGLVDTLVKAAVDRPRPVVDHPVTTAFGKSFPSGHAMSSVVTYGALLVAWWPLLGPVARRVASVATVVLVASIGGSRLLLGVHFVTDVTGGCVLGAAWLAGAVAAFETWTVEARRARLAEERRDRLLHGEPAAPRVSPWGPSSDRSGPGGRIGSAGRAAGDR